MDEEIKTKLIEWAPIETVPLDTDVLVCQSNGDMYVAYLHTNYGLWGREGACWHIKCECIAAEDFHDIDPIYWMPLPEMPKQ